MLFELCDFAGVSITDANLGKGKSREKESLGEERKKRTEEEEKVGLVLTPVSCGLHLS